jgi:hypothetical protein
MVRRRVLLVGGDLVAAALREYFHVCHGDDYEVESIEARVEDRSPVLSRSPLTGRREPSPLRRFPGISSPLASPLSGVGRRR